ncbi:hypothetical protein M231_03048 [Tremella mesenterica]|uniref:Uncharacterized protein n=1 Tax=Tremella mesenterica TaxID=5217 RepID=A0A4Q1BP86_TREME|nr:hypothetical protein M231_03048 [Tremella mesenterica]
MTQEGETERQDEAGFFNLLVKSVFEPGPNAAVIMGQRLIEQWFVIQVIEVPARPDNMPTYQGSMSIPVTENKKDR